MVSTPSEMMTDLRFGQLRNAADEMWVTDGGMKMLSMPEYWKAKLLMTSHLLGMLMDLRLPVYENCSASMDSVSSSSSSLSTPDLIYVSPFNLR